MINEQHDPMCKMNISCAVYHENGICPDSGKCTCKLSVKKKTTEHERGHNLFNEFANVTIGERAKWLEQLVRQAKEEAYKEGYENGALKLGETAKRNYQKGVKEERERIVPLLKVAKCPDIDCDNNGTIAVVDSSGDWEQQQCQWCDEKRIALTAIKEDNK